MRIRKHAARILSALSVGAAAPGAPAAPAGREPEMHVCELNQSPWDAMAFSPPRGEDLYDYQELENMEEELNCFLAGATLTLSARVVEEELAAAVSDASGCPTFIVAAQSSWRQQPKIEEMVEGAEDEEEKRVRKIEAAKKRSSSQGQGRKKHKRKMASSRGRVGAEQEKVKTELESGAAVTTCKKSDGKGWHCKRAAQRPHSLCGYHLTQVRSYYSNGGGAKHVLQQHLQHPRKTQGGGMVAKQNAAFISDMKKSTKLKRATAAKKGGIGADAAGRSRKSPTSDFYYYYSGFGPWRRGKRRRSCGGGGGEGVAAGNVDASDSDEEGDGGAPRDGAPCPRAHDQGPDDLDDDDEDTDGGDEAGGCDGTGDDVAAGRRRGRKPIKARSLKSLL